MAGSNGSLKLSRSGSNSRLLDSNEGYSPLDFVGKTVPIDGKNPNSKGPTLVGKLIQPKGVLKG